MNGIYIKATWGWSHVCRFCEVDKKTFPLCQEDALLAPRNFDSKKVFLLDPDLLFGDDNKEIPVVIITP